jgi:hypothetical protein
MKKVAVMVLLLGVAAGLGFLGAYVWELPHASNVVVFRIVMIGFIPLPIPIGFLSSPHFWGGVLFLLAGVTAFFSVKQLKR